MDELNTKTCPICGAETIDHENDAPCAACQDAELEALRRQDEEAEEAEAADRGLVDCCCNYCVGSGL